MSQPGQVSAREGHASKGSPAPAPLGFCDRCLSEKPTGELKPYTDSRLYKACAGCRAQMTAAAYEAAGFDELSPIEQWNEDGNR